MFDQKLIDFHEPLIIYLHYFIFALFFKQWFFAYIWGYRKFCSVYLDYEILLISLPALSMSSLVSWCFIWLFHSRNLNLSCLLVAFSINSMRIYGLTKFCELRTSFTFFIFPLFPCLKAWNFTFISNTDDMLNECHVLSSASI